MAKKKKKTEKEIQDEFVIKLISKELDVIISLELYTVKNPKKIDVNAFGQEVLDITKKAKVKEDIPYRFWNLFDLMR